MADEPTIADVLDRVDGLRDDIAELKTGQATLMAGQEQIRSDI